MTSGGAPAIAASIPMTIPPKKIANALRMNAPKLGTIVKKVMVKSLRRWIGQAQIRRLGAKDISALNS
jgi:hypothetical protein